MIYTEQIFIVGQDTYLNSVSPACSFGVVFEDDLRTGYLYAVDTEPELKILDALHIYNVANVIDKDKPCKIQIAWSEDGSNGEWGKTSKTKERTLTDDIINKLFVN